jgi:hypothetical protein
VVPKIKPPVAKKEEHAMRTRKRDEKRIGKEMPVVVVPI